MDEELRKAIDNLQRAFQKSGLKGMRIGFGPDGTIIETFAANGGKERYTVVPADAVEPIKHCERRLGEMMAEQPRQGPGEHWEKKRGIENPVTPLGERGIDKNLAHRARRPRFRPRTHREGAIFIFAANFYPIEGGARPAGQRMNNFLSGKTSYAPQWACRTPT